MSTHSTPATKCPELTKAGAPCKGRVLPGSQYCRAHDPALASERVAWSTAGGAAASNEARARKRVLSDAISTEHLDNALAHAALDVLAGELEPAIGTAAASIVRAILATREQLAVNARLDALEAELKYLERGRQHGQI